MSSLFVSVPRLETVNVIATNGAIEITWTFIHTGGQDLDEVKTFCMIDGEGSSDFTYDILMCESNERIDDNLMGSTSLSPVFAGENYTCSVTATNTNGTDTRESINVVPTEGECVIIDI